MKKTIPYFFYTLAVLSSLGLFYLMANSITPLYFGVSAIISGLLLFIIGMLSQIMIDMSERIEMHTEALKYLTRRKRVK